MHDYETPFAKAMLDHEEIQHIQRTAKKYLISAYEEVFNIPEAQRTIEVIDNSAFGIQNIAYLDRQDIPRSQFDEVFQKSLQALGMSQEEFFERAEEFQHRDNCLQALKSRVEQRSDHQHPKSLTDRLAEAQLRCSEQQTAPDIIKIQEKEMGR